MTYTVDLALLSHVKLALRQPPRPRLSSTAERLIGLAVRTGWMYRSDVEYLLLAFWGLQWIWICPGQRRMGHLARHWMDWKRQFGDFVIEASVSDAMRAFAVKQGDAALLE